MSIARKIMSAVVLATCSWLARAGDGPGIFEPVLPEPGQGVEPLLREEQPLSASAFRPWDLESATSREPVRATATYDGLLGTFSSAQTVRDRDLSSGWEDPLVKRGWQADQTWKLSVLGPISVYSNTTLAAEDAMQQDARVSGRTGLALQVPVPIGELVLRGGPDLNYSDPLRQERAKERSEMLLEVQARYPLLFGLRLEFNGTASPAMTPMDRDWVSQEIRLALPVSDSCKLSVGARQRWDNPVEQKTTTDGTQLFLGLELKH